MAEIRLLSGEFHQAVYDGINDSIAAGKFDGEFGAGWKMDLIKEFIHKRGGPRYPILLGFGNYVSWPSNSSSYGFAVSYYHVKSQNFIYDKEGTIAVFWWTK